MDRLVRQEDALAITEEALRITHGTPIPTEDDAKTPASLKSLRIVYRKAMAKLDADRSQRFRPVIAAYTASLYPLRVQLTKAGRLADAAVIQSRIDQVQNESSPEISTAKGLHDYLVGTKWLWYGNKNNELTFSKDGTVEMAQWTKMGLVTGWKVDGKKGVKLSILKGRENNMTATLEFADDLASFTGIDFNGRTPISKSPKL